MKEITLILEELACPDCAQKIGFILEKQKGVMKATVHYATSKVKIQYDPDQIVLEEIIKTIGKTGYNVIQK